MKTNVPEFTASLTAIEGLLDININRLEDERGWFQEKFQKQKLVTAGVPQAFTPVQQNISYNRVVGVTRGVHAEPWDKYVSVVKGEVFAAFVDLRKENFGKTVCIKINPNKAVYVPRGVANSFQTLEDDTYYTYLVNGYWSAENSGDYKFVNLADSELAIKWPIPLNQSIISEKDKNHPPLSAVSPF
jgi:dTDP-4-dehydrorhamnose 3,5-epimerase